MPWPFLNQKGGVRRGGDYTFSLEWATFALVYQTALGPRSREFLSLSVVEGVGCSPGFGTIFSSPLLFKAFRRPDPGADARLRYLPQIVSRQLCWATAGPPVMPTRGDAAKMPFE
jgi:hypothetical protein